MKRYFKVMAAMMFVILIACTDGAPVFVKRHPASVQAMDEMIKRQDTVVASGSPITITREIEALNKATDVCEKTFTMKRKKYRSIADIAFLWSAMVPLEHVERCSARGKGLIARLHVESDISLGELEVIFYFSHYKEDRYTFSKLVRTSFLSFSPKKQMIWRREDVVVPASWHSMFRIPAQKLREYVLARSPKTKNSDLLRIGHDDNTLWDLRVYIGKRNRAIQPLMNIDLSVSFE